MLARSCLISYLTELTDALHPAPSPINTITPEQMALIEQFAASANDTQLLPPQTNRLAAAKELELSMQKTTVAYHETLMTAFPVWGGEPAAFQSCAARPRAPWPWGAAHAPWAHGRARRG